jgi:hypothetical protein
MRNGLRALNVAIWAAEKEHSLDFDELMELKASPEATARLSADLHPRSRPARIEINAEKLDTERASQRHRSLSSTRASRTTTR